jgi:hypothetical protein
MKPSKVVMYSALTTVGLAILSRKFGVRVPGIAR